MAQPMTRAVSTAAACSTLNRHAASLLDCACGNRHESWWRTTQAPSCGLIRHVEHDGLIYTPQQWATYQTLIAAAEETP